VHSNALWILSLQDACIAKNRLEMPLKSKPQIKMKTIRQLKN